MNKRVIMIALLIVLLGAVAAALSQDDAEGRPDIEATRATLAKWLEIQQIISKEKRDWQTGRDVLDQRIALMKSEIKTIEERLAETRTGLGEANEARREIVEEEVALKAAASSLDARIVPLEQKAMRLIKMLPDPIRERVSLLSQRIPKDPATTKLSLGERYQNVVGVLNEVNKFNQDITVTSELRELADGSTAEVQAMYVGLGQAFYVTQSGERAGVGVPSPDGWVWQERNEIAADVKLALAVLQNEAVPGYVPLPVTIR